MRNLAFVSPDRDQTTVQPGDLVRTGLNLYPHYSVVAVDEPNDMAWVRNVDTGQNTFAQLHRCQKLPN